MIHIASVFHHTKIFLRKLVPDFNLFINLKGFVLKTNIAKQSQKNVSFVNLKFTKF